MPVRELPARPNLEHLKKQARQLLRGIMQADSSAVDRFREAQVTLPSAAKLAQAQLVIAREYGFDNWANLKAQVGALSDDPVEALTTAIKANDGPLVRQVLARYPVLKATLNEPLPNYSFDTPAIVAAVQKDNRDMVDALLDAGADINARSRWWAGGFGVLDSSSQELTPYLIQRGAYVDIHAAARLGMFQRVKELVEADPALVHARGGDGQTPLHFASSVEIAGYLLDHGAEIDARDVDHESTAAQYMVGHWPRRSEVARYLIARGAEPDILMAAALGDLELVRSLVDENPASVWVSVAEKYFPKRNPESGGHIYIFSFGWTRMAHMLAHEFGHQEVFRLLMQRSPLSLRFAQACDAGEEALANDVLKKHPDVIKTMPEKVSRLILGAAFRRNTRAVEMMLNAGWPAAVFGEYGQTPLHWAAFHGNAEMVTILLAHEAPLEAEEQQFKGTPLGWALHGSRNSWHRDKGDYPRVVEALLAAGAKLSRPVEDIEAPEEVLDVLLQQAARLH
jgi:ankyrin repeat protein